MSIARSPLLLLQSLSLWLALTAGCGDPGRGRLEPPVSEPRDTGEIESMPVQDQPANAASDETPAADGGLAATQQSAVSHEECERFLDHFLALAQAQHASTESPEYLPTAEQVAEIRAGMAPVFLRLCLTMERATYECSMQARDRDEMVRCMPEGL